MLARRIVKEISATYSVDGRVLNNGARVSRSRLPTGSTSINSLREETPRFTKPGAPSEERLRAPSLKPLKAGDRVRVRGMSGPKPPLLARI
jgi:hypothetical protein